MKRIVLFIFIFISLQSCMSYKEMFTIIPEQTAGEIPVGANKITIKNNNLLEENYLKSFKIALSQNYRIEASNKELGYVSASKKDEGDTYVRLNIICGNDSVMVTSEWKAGMESTIYASALSGVTINPDWENAQWNKRADKSSISFAKAVLFSKEISSDLIYQVPKAPIPEKYWGMEKK